MSMSDASHFPVYHLPVCQNMFVCTLNCHCFWEIPTSCAWFVPIIRTAFHSSVSEDFTPSSTIYPFLSERFQLVIISVVGVCHNVLRCLVSMTVIACCSSLCWNFHLHRICRGWRRTILSWKTTSYEFTNGFCHMKNSDYYLTDPQYHILMILADMSMLEKHFLVEEHFHRDLPLDFSTAENFFSPSELICLIYSTT